VEPGSRRARTREVAAASIGMISPGPLGERQGRVHFQGQGSVLGMERSGMSLRLQAPERLEVVRGERPQTLR